MLLSREADVAFCIKQRIPKRNKGRIPGWSRLYLPRPIVRLLGAPGLKFSGVTCLVVDDDDYSKMKL